METVRFIFKNINELKTSLPVFFTKELVESRGKRTSPLSAEGMTLVIVNKTHPTGKILTDEEGNEYEEHVQTEGVHVDVLCDSDRAIQYKELPQALGFAPEIPAHIFSAKGG